MSIQKEKDVKDVILKYEVKFTKLLESFGFTSSSFIAYNPNNEYPYVFSHDLTHCPVYMMEQNCPVIKRKAFLKEGCCFDGMGKVFDYLLKRNKQLAKLIAKDVHFDKTGEFFSIIMPTYNRKELISKAINSVLNQSYQNFELIIVDDGSIDNTGDFIKENYKKEINLGKIKYFYKKNEGVCKARNYGLSKAKNSWIAYVDSDNVIFGNFLEIFNKYIQKHKNLVYYSKFKNINSNKCPVKAFDFNKLKRGNYIDLGVFVHHKSIYEKLGGFDENMTRLVDYDLIFRYTSKYKPYFIDKVLMLYNDIDDRPRISNNCNLVDNFNYFKKKHLIKELPIVTTIITSYNHKIWIRQAIDSAIYQQGDFIHEIIISDDMSTDGTREIIEEYSKKYPNLIKNISPSKNLGISKNMEHCFKEAKGKYVAILEGDDYWTDNHKLDKQMKFLQKNKDCSMVFSKIQVLRNGRFCYTKIQNSLSKTKLKGWDFFNLKEGTFLSLIGNFSCCMFLSKYLKHLPNILFQYRFSEIPLSLYLEKKGYIGFMKNSLSVYRQHDGSVWTGASKFSQIEQGLKVREIAYQVCDNKYKSRLKYVIDAYKMAYITLQKNPYAQIDISCYFPKRSLFDFIIKKSISGIKTKRSFLGIPLYKSDKQPYADWAAKFYLFGIPTYIIRQKGNVKRHSLFNFFPLYKRDKSSNTEWTKKFYVLGIPTYIVRLKNGIKRYSLFNFIPLYKRQRIGNNYVKKFYLFGLQTLVFRKQNGKRIAKTNKKYR